VVDGLKLYEDLIDSTGVICTKYFSYIMWIK